MKNTREPLSLLSVVVPVMNEEENVTPLYERLSSALESANWHWECVIVDDGSTDGTWEALRHLRLKNARLKLVRLKRNFGQTAAMRCGIDKASGDVIVTMDGDLQNDPSDIPRLVAKLSEGFDVVCGWRNQRQDKLWSRKVPSMIANRLIGWLTGVLLHDYGCSLKAYRAASIKRTPLYAELHRFIPAMATLTGAAITEIQVNHHARQYGSTKYTIARTWRVAFDMITVALLVKCAARPLRFFGGIALIAGAATIITLIQIGHVFTGPFTAAPLILSSIAILTAWLASHALMIGLIAELFLATVHGKLERLIVVEGER